MKILCLLLMLSPSASAMFKAPLPPEFHESGAKRSRPLPFKDTLEEMLVPSPGNYTFHLTKELPSPETSTEKFWKLRQKIWNHYYAKARLQTLHLPASFSSASPFFAHIDTLILNPGMENLAMDLPPLPKIPPRDVFLKQLDIGIQRLHAIFSPALPRELSSHTLPHHLSARDDRFVPNFYTRIQRWVDEIFTYQTKDVSYAERLFDLLKEAESACVDNAITQLEMAEDQMMLHQALQGQDDSRYLRYLLRMGVNNYKKTLVLNYVIQQMGRCRTLQRSSDTVEGYLYTYGLVQNSLNLYPRHPSLAFDATSRCGLNYLDALDYAMTNMTAESLVHFLTTIDGADMTQRQILYHMLKVEQDETGQLAESLSEPDVFEVLLSPTAQSDLHQLGYLTRRSNYPNTTGDFLVHRFTSGSKLPPR